ncbi:hypothetical protein [Haliscomenobacter sp.]|uniref:hypothetical protein n=1 Tax=Haliscomenobacter sp. TaxID=2717303 RepID=UPI003364E77D
MRAYEIMEDISVGTSGSGSMATVSQPIGMIARSGGSLLTGKYSTDPTPNTPKEYKRNKNARGQFKNSIGN